MLPAAILSIYASSFAVLSITPVRRKYKKLRFRMTANRVFRDHQNKCDYIEHYPLGKPNDDVASEIPEHIRADFREALRCRWVDAYNATAEMCRRAVQASCIHLGAPSEKLVKQIDWLAANGKITTPLREMAHRIRLGGNFAAHPPEDPDGENEIVMGPEYADAVLEFTGDFFQHVYVMPERLSKYTFKKAPPIPPAP
jgi:hypothetical protein